MDWIGAILKLVAWQGLAKQQRWGFLLAVTGNLMIGIPAAKAGLYGIAFYCCFVTWIQIKGWFHWKGTA